MTAALHYNGYTAIK